MKKQTRRKPSEDSDTMRPEYDFSKGVRGKHAARYAQGTNVVVLEPDVAKAFGDSAAVNTALRSLLNLTSSTQRLTKRSSGRGKERRAA